MPDRFSERITQLRDLGCVITEAATSTARYIVGQLPHLTVGVFPAGEEQASGGINLQAVTDTSTVIVAISPDGDPEQGECADGRAYYEQRLWDRSDALRWFNEHAPQEEAHA